MEFKSFKLTENNCSAQNAVYEGCKTEDGVHLEYYMSSNDWDNELSCFVESRDVIRSVDGDENLYREVCALFGNCRIDEWAGFQGANPPRCSRRKLDELFCCLGGRNGD